MSAIVESVARKLYERNPRYDQETDVDGRPTTAPYRIGWDDLIEYDDGHREDILEDARVCIEATLIGLREPSEALLETGWLHLPTPYEQSGEDDGALRLCWRAMIDQALAEVRQS